MKTIEERADEFAGGPLDPNEHLVITLQRRAFCNGARSEHEELTRWNSPYEHPAPNEDGNARSVLMKFPDGDYGIGFYHDYWSDECDNNVSIIGWREIHE